MYALQYYLSHVRWLLLVHPHPTVVLYTNSFIKGHWADAICGACGLHIIGDHPLQGDGCHHQALHLCMLCSDNLEGLNFVTCCSIYLELHWPQPLPQSQSQLLTASVNPYIRPCLRPCLHPCIFPYLHSCPHVGHLWPHPTRVPPCPHGGRAKGGHPWS